LKKEKKEKKKMQEDEESDWDQRVGRLHTTLARSLVLLSSDTQHHIQNSEGQSFYLSPKEYFELFAVPEMQVKFFFKFFFYEN
jgi:hypothetical protein